MKLSEIIKKYRESHDLSQRQFGAQCGLSTGYISLIEKEINPQTGKPMVPSLPVMNKLSIGMGLTLDELLAMCDDMDVSLNDRDLIAPAAPMPENIEGDVDIPEHIHADFALRCKGDSMINARIYDGDIVYIRQQDTVEHGQIAAVLINDEATLKRVHLFPDHVVLEAENPQYRPRTFWGEEMNSLRILGRAVAFTSDVR